MENQKIQQQNQHQQQQQPPQPIRIFINECNSFLSQAIVEEIRNDNQTFEQLVAGEVVANPVREHRIYGTLTARENAPEPNGVSKVIPKNKKKAIYQTILSSDVSIFDITSGTDEVDAVVKFLKEQSEMTKEITLIIISSVMSWAGTPPKFPSSSTDRFSVDDEDMTPEEREKRTTTDFLEDDYLTRIPSTRFSNLRHIENLVMQLPKFQPLVKPYIVCAGLLYGNGERIFYEHFRKAWTGLNLPQLGEGTNMIPTIHVCDVAKLIKKMIFGINPRTQKIPKYILAVDHGNNSQKEIVQALVKQKEKRINQVDIFDVYSEEWSDYLNIDLKMRPSILFDSKFEWTCKDGMCKNITEIMEQFATYRGLNAIKVVVVGPPMSGKSELAKYLKQYLKIKKMTIKDAFDYVKKFKKEDLAKDLMRREEEIKDKIVEEHEKSKKKGPELERDHIKVKMPESVLGKIVKFTLDQPEIYTKGLILDNFPKSLKQAYRAYYDHDEDCEYVNDSFYENIKDAKLSKQALPNIVFYMKCSRDAAHQRFKIYSQANSHLGVTEVDFERRFNEYENNIQGLIDFFRDLSLPQTELRICEIDTMGKKLDEIAKTAKDIIFQQYKFLDYLYVSEDNEKALIEKLQKQEEQRLKDEAIKKQQQALLAQQQLENAAKAQGGASKRVNNRLSKIEEKKHWLLDTRSLPIRQYLLDKVIPTLTSGIMTFTDKIDFEKISEETLASDKPPYEGDILEHLIGYFESKGEDLQQEYLEQKRKREELLEMLKQKSIKKAQGGEDSDESDPEYESPEEMSNN